LPLIRRRRGARSLDDHPDARFNADMPTLTRKRVNDRPATWHVHYAGVRDPNAEANRPRSWAWNRSSLIEVSATLTVTAARIFPKRDAMFAAPLCGLANRPGVFRNQKAGARAKAAASGEELSRLAA
jgi:hypothetical protein